MVPGDAVTTDQSTITAQLGRPVRALSEVVVRCHLGLPVVVEVPPVLVDGTPFPTRFWLSCPLAVRRVARLESAGQIKAMDERAKSDEEFGARLRAAHHRYQVNREPLIPSEATHRPTGGVGGSAGGIKCLHAHYADHAAGRVDRSCWDNPVGAAVAVEVEPLDCLVACVVDGVRNPEWREPK